MYNNVRQKRMEKYAKIGNLKMVQKYVNDPNVSINSGQGYILRVAMSSGCIECVNLIMNHPNIDLFPTKTANPMLNAISVENILVLEIMFKNHLSSFMNTIVLDRLITADQEIIDYFMDQDAFREYVSTIDGYYELISEDAREMFLF